MFPEGKDIPEGARTYVEVVTDSEWTPDIVSFLPCLKHELAGRTFNYWVYRMWFAVFSDADCLALFWAQEAHEIICFHSTGL